MIPFHRLLPKTPAGPMRRWRPAWCFMALVILVSVGCGTEPLPDRSASGNSRTLPENSGLGRAKLEAAIHRAAKYIVEACDGEGRFAYRINLDPDFDAKPGYNVLRHAGTVYALGQYCRYHDAAQSQAALLRAARFMKKRCVGPAAKNPDFLAVWSEPGLVGVERRQAKLGGTGLGLVALLSVEKVKPGVTSIEELRQLGRFLIFMQKGDGSFYSKFYPETGRYDLWRSAYYPGEAALGLLMLYERDPAQQWLHTATKSLENLARRGSKSSSPFADHWYLLSLKQWFEVAPSRYRKAAQTRLLDHARRICQEILEDQRSQRGVVELHGAFTPDGRTCPSATRLEGLLAALRFLPPEDETLRRQVAMAVERGLPFLLHGQVTEGPYAGAFPRYTPGFIPQALGDANRRRLREVRIDYVQHALSAMLAGQQALFSAH